MKNKIAFKLTIYFVIVILIFTSIMGCIFILAFRNNTIEIYKNNMLKRAQQISANFLDLKSGQGNGQSGGMNGNGGLTKYLNDIALADVWIIDKNGLPINSAKCKYGVANSSNSISSKEISQIDKQYIQMALGGKQVATETFSSIYNKTAITIAVPIKNVNNEVTGAVLLFTPVDSVNNAINQGVLILLLSVGIGVIVSVILGIVLSYKFTRPLKIMNKTALQLAEKHYEITNNIKQNDEIGELATSLRILAERLFASEKQSIELEKMRKDFIANVSHELRTPVTVIRGTTEMLLYGVVTERSEQNNSYKQILNECKGLESLIRDLLDLTRLQNTDFKMNMVILNAKDVIYDVIRSSQRLASSKNITIETEMSATNYNIKGDYDRLKQMFLNLIDNAIKFSPENAKIKIAMQNVVESNQEKLVFSVVDYGIGIPKDEVPYIFERFHKTTSVLNKNGTGLGLTIVKQIAERHHVKILVESSEGNGTVFSLAFETESI